MLTYILAVLAACANATSSVLQRKANKRVPQKENMSLRQIRDLLRQPVWFGGIAAITVGFLLQASALGEGELSVVEPVLVLELPFTLIVASWVFRSRLGLREWVPTAAMTAGLAGLLYLLAPTAGAPPELHWYEWLAGVGGNLLLVGFLVLMARRGSFRGVAKKDSGEHGAQHGGSFRAAVLAVAAGSAFGLTAALMKAMTRTFEAGILHAFTDWPIYAMVATGALGMFLTQSALNAGPLIAAQPGLTLSDPLISVLWGVMAFQEQVQQGWFILGQVACAAVIVAGVITLARSPLLADDSSGGEREQGKPDRGVTWPGRQHPAHPAPDPGSAR